MPKEPLHAKRTTHDSNNLPHGSYIDRDADDKANPHELKGDKDQQTAGTEATKGNPRIPNNNSHSISAVGTR
jgi:hypothetical protein